MWFRNNKTHLSTFLNTGEEGGGAPRVANDNDILQQYLSTM